MEFPIQKVWGRAKKFAFLGAAGITQDRVPAYQAQSPELKPQYHHIYIYIYIYNKYICMYIYFFIYCISNKFPNDLDPIMLYT
jgi:hypothetical protein